jgi:hypothetical protein
VQSFVLLQHVTRASIRLPAGGMSRYHTVPYASAFRILSHDRSSGVAVGTHHDERDVRGVAAAAAVPSTSSAAALGTCSGTLT